MGKPIREESYDDVIASIKDYDVRYLDYIKYVRARLDFSGWLDQDEVNEPAACTRDLKIARDAVLIAGSELVRLVGTDTDRNQLILHAKLSKVLRNLANELDLLRMGWKSDFLQPAGRQNQKNAPHRRRFRQTIGSALVMLAGPKRGRAGGGDNQSWYKGPTIMGRGESIGFVLDVFGELDFEAEQNWVKKQFDLYFDDSDSEYGEHAFTSFPSRLQLYYDRLNVDQKCDDKLIRNLVRKELLLGLTEYLEAEKADPK